jgi:hypothetical protein
MAAPEQHPSPHHLRRRHLRVVRFLGGGLVVGFLIAILALNVLARTRFGHEKVLSLTLAALGKNIRGGDLSVGRVSGNLFEGAKLYQVALRDRQGVPFVLADSAFAVYSVTTLLSPRIHLRSLTLYSPDIYVRKLPGDSLWNYQRIFSDTAAVVDTLGLRVERVVVADTVRIESGRVRMEMPFVADTTLSAAGQRRMIREALADTSPVMVHRAAGGYLRTVNVDSLGGRLTGVRFAPGARSGSRFHLDSVNARVQFYRRPFRLVRARGDLALFPDHVEFDAPMMRVNRSPMAASGTIRFDRGPDPAYDVALRSDSLALDDLQWLYPRFPGNARVSLQMLIETRPDGTRFDFRRTHFVSPGTDIRGNFAMIAGPKTLVFSGVNLVARPVRIATIERMMPDGLPVRGLVLGGATIRGTGPASAEGPVSAAEAAGGASGAR